MSVLFDDISRLVASPLPRRRVMALVAGSVAGTALGSLWPARTAAAQTGCFFCGCNQAYYTDFNQCLSACNPTLAGNCFTEICLTVDVSFCVTICPEGLTPCGKGCCAPNSSCVDPATATCSCLGTSCSATGRMICCPPIKPYCNGDTCSSFDAPVRAAWDYYSDIIGAADATFGTIAFIATVLGAIAGLEVVFGVVGTAFSVLTMLSILIRGLDPPDPNFTVVAQPVTPSLSRQPVTAAQAGGQRQADAVNALLTNAEQAIGVGRAFITSVERAWGAFNAGDTAWETRQTQAARQYAAQLSGLFNAEPQLLSEIRDALQAAGLQQTRPLTASDEAEFQAQIGRDGLPSQLVQDLTDLGFDRTAQDELRQAILGQDPNMAAGLGGGNVLLALTDPTVVNAFQGIAQVFSQFAGPVTPPSCSLVAAGTNGQGQQYIQVAVQDTDDGLQTVTVTTLTNATAGVGTYRTGITTAPTAVLTGDHPTAPVLVTATKLDQTQGSQLALDVGDQAGNVTTCDPILATVGREPGVPHRQTFHHVARRESRISVHNGRPGLTHLLLLVNGKRFELEDLKDGESRAVDVAGAMRRGNNTITLEAVGKTKGSATVLIADQ